VHKFTQLSHTLIDVRLKAHFCDEIAAHTEAALLP